MALKRRLRLAWAPFFTSSSPAHLAGRNVSGRAERPSVQAAATVQKICRLFVMPSIYPLTSIVATKAQAETHGDTDPAGSRRPAWPPAAFSYSHSLDRSQETRGISGRNSAAGEGGLNQRWARSKLVAPGLFFLLHLANYTAQPLIKDFQVARRAYMSNRGPRIAELRKQIHRRHREAIQALSVRRPLRPASSCLTEKQSEHARQIQPNR